MKLSHLIRMLSCCLMIFISVAVNAQEASELQDRKLLILASSKDYNQLVETAKFLSTKTGIPYSTRGMIYDAKRGLIFPDNYDDEVYAGSYALRRYTLDCSANQEECLTIELSEAYQGLTPGLFIVVAGIYETNDAALDKKLAEIKKTVPDAYAKTTKIFMGCMH